MPSAAVTTSNAGAGAAGDNTIVAAPTNGQIIVLGYQLMGSAALSVKLMAGATGATGGSDLTGAYPFPANGGLVAPPVGPTEEPYGVVPAGLPLVANVSAGVVTGAVQYAIRGGP